ncbi:hypothetical protein HWV62_45107 [Athelia sp. TMB]|nr:hypothetical protein HWV62_45107 [Athelia sp. TMB]
MSHIPFISVDRVSVRVRADGRFGEEDFTLNPQIYSKKYAHRMLVHCCPTIPCPESVMWWTPDRDNFQSVAVSSYRNLGRLCSSKLRIMDDLTWKLRLRAFDLIACDPTADWSVLEGLVANMRYGVMRLKHNPFTFQEMVMDVAQTQRLYLDALSMCDYAQDNWSNRLHSAGPMRLLTRAGIMGAWSSDPSVVQLLHHSGVPVYFVRPPLPLETGDKHVIPPHITRDGEIITADWGVPDRYTGPPGEALHAAASVLNSYGDLDKIFLDLDEKGVLHPVGERGAIHRPQPSAGKPKVKTRKSRSSALNVSLVHSAVRDKWLEITGDFVPITIPHWSKALCSVNRNDRSSIIAPKDFTGYRFPDPGMLVFSDARKEKNVFNWLLIRDASIRRLMHDVLSEKGVPRGFSNELWRMILGVEFSDGDKQAATSLAASSSNVAISRSTPHSERRQAAIAIFGQPPDGHNHDTVQWRGHTVPWGTFFEHDPLLVQEIMWDIHQHSFQFDVIALDRYLCPALWESEYHARQNLVSKAIGCDDCFVIQDTPTRDFGLGSQDEAERMSFHINGDKEDVTLYIVLTAYFALLILMSVSS